MIKKFYPYCKIGQFKDAIQEVNKTDSSDDNILNYKGTVKLHGTNAAIVGIFSKGKIIDIYTQSRNRVLSIEEDNAGFAAFVHKKERKFLEKMLRLPFEYIGEPVQKTAIILYGEFCGGTIQKNVAVSQLQKMFVIFDIKFDNFESNETGSQTEDSEPDEPFIKKWYYQWDHSFPDESIYNINQFDTYEIQINMKEPKLWQNKLVELTQKVEDECPVGKYFNVSGVGEGIVWKCIDHYYRSSRYYFKVKGSLHSVIKVKTMKELAPVHLEKLKTIQEFLDKTVTDNRLNQGIDYLKEMNLPVSLKSTGEYIKWVTTDIFKEEKDALDPILDVKEVSKRIGSIARSFLTNY